MRKIYNGFCIDGPMAGKWLEHSEPIYKAMRVDEAAPKWIDGDTQCKHYPLDVAHYKNRDAFTQRTEEGRQMTISIWSVDGKPSFDIDDFIKILRLAEK